MNHLDKTQTKLKFSKISILGLILNVLLLTNCKKSNDIDKGNVSFGYNTYRINCIVTGEVFIDNKSLGVIPGSCDSVVDCNSGNTLNTSLKVGKHNYKIEIKGQSGNCYNVKEGSFELKKNECVKIFMDLTK